MNVLSTNAWCIRYRFPPYAPICPIEVRLPILDITHCTITLVYPLILVTSRYPFIQAYSMPPTRWSTLYHSVHVPYMWIGQQQLLEQRSKLMKRKKFLVDGGEERNTRRVCVPRCREDLKLLDNTSADSLYGSYITSVPSSIFMISSGSLLRTWETCNLNQRRTLVFSSTICVSSMDPPVVVVTTPKCFQEIVASCHTSIPAGFRSR